MSGRLNWASQAVFKKLGRAMLYPIYRCALLPLMCWPIDVPRGQAVLCVVRQVRKKSPKVEEPLKLAIQWWLEVLRQDLCEKRCWKAREKPCHLLLCDARGSPPRVAAVLFAGRERFYSDWEPCEAVMRNFMQRNDDQIMGLEILSIAFGCHLDCGMHCAWDMRISSVCRSLVF